MRLELVKNHLGIFHAIGRLRQGGIQVALAIAGEGPLLATLQQAASEMGLSEHVHFLGNVVQVATL